MPVLVDRQTSSFAVERCFGKRVRENVGSNGATASRVDLHWGPALNVTHNDQPPPAERRPKPRKRVLLRGIITFAKGAHSFDCTIRNLSESGARLLVGKSAQFPSDFYLINVRDGLLHEAKLIWNKGEEIGVAFKSTSTFDTITDPALGFLKRLWLSKAAR